jgi:hypothetical protein
VWIWLDSAVRCGGIPAMSALDDDGEGAGVDGRAEGEIM